MGGSRQEASGHKTGFLSRVGKGVQNLFLRRRHPQKETAPDSTGDFIEQDTKQHLEAHRSPSASGVSGDAESLADSLAQPAKVKEASTEDDDAKSTASRNSDFKNRLNALLLPGMGPPMGIRRQPVHADAGSMASLGSIEGEDEGSVSPLQASPASLPVPSSNPADSVPSETSPTHLVGMRHKLAVGRKRNRRPPKIMLQGQPSEECQSISASTEALEQAPVPKLKQVPSQQSRQDDLRTRLNEALKTKLLAPRAPSPTLSVDGRTSDRSSPVLTKGSTLSVDNLSSGRSSPASVREVQKNPLSTEQSPATNQVKSSTEKIGLLKSTNATGETTPSPLGSSKSSKFKKLLRRRSRTPSTSKKTMLKFFRGRSKSNSALETSTFFSVPTESKFSPPSEKEPDQATIRSSVSITVVNPEEKPSRHRTNLEIPRIRGTKSRPMESHGSDPGEDALNI